MLAAFADSNCNNYSSSRRLFSHFFFEVHFPQFSLSRNSLTAVFRCCQTTTNAYLTEYNSYISALKHNKEPYCYENSFISVAENDIEG